MLFPTRRTHCRHRDDATQTHGAVTRRKCLGRVRYLGQHKAWLCYAILGDTAVAGRRCCRSRAPSSSVRNTLIHIEREMKRRAALISQWDRDAGVWRCPLPFIRLSSAYSPQSERRLPVIFDIAHRLNLPPADDHYDMFVGLFKSRFNFRQRDDDVEIIAASDSVVARHASPYPTPPRHRVRGGRVQHRDPVGVLLIPGAHQ